jgi:hypothetical protein
MSEIASLKQQMETMAQALKELTLAVKKSDKSKSKSKSKSTDDDSDTPKPKRVQSEGMIAWKDFQTRVRSVLKEAELTLKSSENMQFCSSLKAKDADYESWDNDTILEERENWAKPEKSKQEIAGKNKRAGSSKSSVASKEVESDEEVEEKVVVAEVKKPRGRPPKEKAVEKVEKKVEQAPKPRGRPSKKVAEVKDEAEDDDYDGELSAFKWKGKMLSKTDRHDVVDEDSYSYLGRWNEKTNIIDEKHAMPAYIKNLLAELEKAND